MRPSDVLIAHVCDLSCKRVRRVSEKRETAERQPYACHEGSNVEG